MRTWGGLYDWLLIANIYSINSSESIVSDIGSDSDSSKGLFTKYIMRQGGEGICKLLTLDDKGGRGSQVNVDIDEYCLTKGGGGSWLCWHHWKKCPKIGKNIVFQNSSRHLVNYCIAKLQIPQESLHWFKNLRRLYNCLVVNVVVILTLTVKNESKKCTKV